MPSDSSIDPTEPTIYLDHAATTRVAPAVREAMLGALGEDFGNPSSRHPLGARAREQVESARRRIARAVGAEPSGVLFTSGGTEANNLAVIGETRGAGHGKVLIGSTEHPSVRASGVALTRVGFEVANLPLDTKGAVDMPLAAEMIDERTVVVAQMLVNNEFGTRYDVERLMRAVGSRGHRATHVHIDAVQALGKLELDAHGLFGDTPGSFALSAHKIHGPKGVGALVLSPSAMALGRVPQPLLHGGGQQLDLRPGTENVPGILGFAAAVELATADLAGNVTKLVAARVAFEGALADQVPKARVLVPWSDDGSQAPHVVSVLVPGAPAEVWLHHLEELGVYASAGSACQASKSEISPALLALGLKPEQAKRVLRFSFATGTTPGECITAVGRLASLVGRLSKLG